MGRDSFQAIGFGRLLGSLGLSILALTAAPVSGRAEDWTGIYFGLGIGADGVDGSLSLETVDQPTVTGKGIGGGDIGASVRLGADYQINSMFVVGVVGIYDWSGIETKAYASTPLGDASANLLSLDESWTIAGRFGVLVTPDLLAYALAGYSRVTFGDVTFDAPNVSFALARSPYDTLALGAGLEYRLNANWSLAAEYRRAELERRDLLASLETDTSLFSDPTMHWARISAIYRLGGAQSDASSGSPSVPSRSWTGFYLGGGGALLAATRDLDISACNGGDCASLGLEGLGGGGYAVAVLGGFDYRMGRFVAGAFVDYEWSEQNIKLTIEDPQVGEASINLLGLDRSWTVGGRLGYLVSEDLLIYGLAGYTDLRFKDIEVSGAGANVSFELPGFKGYTVGVGFEKLWGTSISTRLEYRYVDLGAEALTDTNVVDEGVLSLDPSLHSVRASLVYRFATGQ